MGELVCLLFIEPFVNPIGAGSPAISSSIAFSTGFSVGDKNPDDRFNAVILEGLFVCRNVIRRKDISTNYGIS